jgi:hypothetical protein
VAIIEGRGLDVKLSSEKGWQNVESKYENDSGLQYELLCEIVEEEWAKAQNRLTGKIKSVIRKENFGGSLRDGEKRAGSVF